jgi:hypothetical protein
VLPTKKIISTILFFQEATVLIASVGWPSTWDIPAKVQNLCNKFGSNCDVNFFNLCTDLMLKYNVVTKIFLLVLVVSKTCFKCRFMKVAETKKGSNACRD